MYVHTHSNKQLFDNNNPVTPCSHHSGASPSSPPPTQIASKLPNLEILIPSVFTTSFLSPLKSCTNAEFFLLFFHFHRQNIGL